MLTYKTPQSAVTDSWLAISISTLFVQALASPIKFRFFYIHPKPPPSSSSWPPTCSSNINIPIPIYSPSFFWTCPNHLSLPLLTIPQHLICAALLMYSFMSFSTLVTHKANLNILISAPFSSVTCLLPCVFVSKPQLLHHTSPPTFISTSTLSMTPPKFH